MDKQKFDSLDYSEEPIFNEKFLTTNMYCQTSSSDGGIMTFVYRMNENGKPCFSQYINGKNNYTLVFKDLEGLKEWHRINTELLQIFSEWMEEYDKIKAKTIDINTRI